MHFKSLLTVLEIVLAAGAYLGLIFDRVLWSGPALSNWRIGCWLAPIALVGIIEWSCVHVPDGHYRLVRNHATGNVRKILDGTYWTWPWESLVKVVVPCGIRLIPDVVDLQSEHSYVYQFSEPFNAVTADHLEIHVWLRVEYRLRTLSDAVDEDDDVSILSDLKRQVGVIVRARAAALNHHQAGSQFLSMAEMIYVPALEACTSIKSITATEIRATPRALQTLRAEYLLRETAAGQRPPQPGQTNPFMH